MVYLVEFQYEIANIESNVLDQGVTPRDPHLTPLDQVTLDSKPKCKNVRVYGIHYQLSAHSQSSERPCEAKPLACQIPWVDVHRTDPLESCRDWSFRMPNSGQIRMNHNSTIRRRNEISHSVSVDLARFPIQLTRNQNVGSLPTHTWSS